MQPSGMSVLYELGLLEKVLAHGKRVSRILGRDAFSLKPVLDVNYRELGQGQFGLGIHRHALFSLLFEEAKNCGVSFELNTEIVAVEQKTDKICPIDHFGHVFSAHDLVVIASGSESAVAESLFGDYRRGELPYGALWATLDWPQNCDLHNDMLEQRYRGASKMVGVLPLGNNDTRDDNQEKAALFWSVKGTDIAMLKSHGLAKWKDEVLSHWPQTDVLLSQISDFDQLTFAQYSHYTLKKPHNGRVVFIGDAWHSTSPQLGQGANMALLDAKALYHVLADGQGWDNIGAKYHRLRSRQITIYQTLSKMLTPFYQSDSALLGFVRDHFVSVMVKIPPAPALMAGMVSGMFAEPFKVNWWPGECALKLDQPDWSKFG